MGSVLKALPRIIVLVAMVVAVVGTARPAEAAPAQLDASSLAVLGDGSCGFEDDDDKLVVCGREILSGLVDSSWLLMPEGQCTDLLDKLFAGQRCALEDPDCHRASPASPVVPAPKLQTSSSPMPTLVGRGDLRQPPARRSWLPAANDDVPTSLSLSPPERPPRGA